MLPRPRDRPSRSSLGVRAAVRDRRRRAGQLRRGSRRRRLLRLHGPCLAVAARDRAGPRRRQPRQGPAGGGGGAAAVLARRARRPRPAALDDRRPGRAGRHPGRPRRRARRRADARGPRRGPRGAARGARAGPRLPGHRLPQRAGRRPLAAAVGRHRRPAGVDTMPRAWHEAAGWVVREGVTNVLRHSSASFVEITYTDGELRRGERWRPRPRRCRRLRPARPARAARAARRLAPRATGRRRPLGRPGRLPGSGPLSTNHKESWPS